MSQSGSQAAAFRRDVAEKGEIWTLEDAGGLPAPTNADGRRSMPFWSTRTRAETVLRSVGAYAGFKPRRLTLEEFAGEWLDGLERDGLLVGVNWSGPRATGFDVEPSTVREWLVALRDG